MSYGEDLQDVDSMLHKQRSLVTFTNCDCLKDLMDILCRVEQIQMKMLCRESARFFKASAWKYDRR
jgi:hypothetical protein